MVFFSYNQLEEHEGQKNSSRLVVRVTERAIDRRGQRLLLPEIEVEGWWTSHNRIDQLGKMGFGFVDIDIAHGGFLIGWRLMWT